jgi:toxin ParE1/3/4
LLSVWRYFARVGSVEVADNVLREIHRGARRAAEHPLMGRPREELAAGLRSMLVHPHVILYRTSQDSVEIARVLHQRRDLAAVFERTDQ